MEVNESLISAVVKLWDLTYWRFIFNQEDMTPAIKGYTVLLRMEMEGLDIIYLRDQNVGYRRKLAGLTGLKVEEVGAHVMKKNKS
ncbi:hypothetical protein V6N13_046941 [Hibiscus sabdariffa]|uniref:Uncharacterized protein n=2 Tax=Hibiscus sabdariffa TaxID=183260 RepID=A0ABR2ASN3_9ROSI